MLFRSYDDNGAIIVNQVSMIESGTFSQATGTTQGAISAMYDSDPATYYSLAGLVADAGAYYVKWDMRQKIKFRNIYAFVGLQGSASETASLQGNNDGGNWDTLSTKTAKGDFNLVTSNVSYRYIRLYFNCSGHWDACNIYSVKAVI